MSCYVGVEKISHLYDMQLFLHYFIRIIYLFSMRTLVQSFIILQSVFLNLAAQHFSESMQRDASNGLRLRRHGVTLVTT